MPPESAVFGPLEIHFDAEEVLRPRPWTLAQSTWAAELAGSEPVLELGCGAGQIGLAAVALAGAAVVQVDRSEAACRWAGRNAAANGLDALAVQRCGTAEEVLSDGERFAVVIADPPYVPSAGTWLYPEDPLGAIDGGPDGLALVRDFVAGAYEHLAPEGFVVLQVRGEAQATETAAWLREPGSPPLEVAATRTFGPDRALALLMPRNRG